MNLIRDVLDQQIIDSKQLKAGKVDGIALEVEPGKAPRVAYLDCGMNVRMRRISPRLARWLHRLSVGFRGGQEPRPYRIPFSKVEQVLISVNLKVDARELSDFHLEDWLRERVIAKIPGNKHHKHQEKND